MRGRSPDESFLLRLHEPRRSVEGRQHVVGHVEDARLGWSVISAVRDWETIFA